MLRLFTIITFSLFISGTLSAEYADKGCNKKGCDEYEWYNKGRFNPLTIHFPLHYTGEIYKDRRDGGAHDIEIAYSSYGGNWRQQTLSNYRHQPECPSPTYMSRGVRMHDAFECVNEAYDKPSWKNSPCSDIFSSYEDKHVYVDGPACSKIIREWTIVDWCQYKPNTRANTYQDRFVLVHDTYKDKAYFTYGRGKHDVEYDGWYSFKQVIKIVDKHKPQMATCEDVEIELTNQKCAAHVKLKNKIVDAGPCAGKKMTVEAIIKNAAGKVIDTKWVNAHHDEYFSTNIGYLDAGHYMVHWKFKDGCGNTNECYQNVKVVDKSAPHMLCIKDLSTSVSDKYGTAIWAEDFAFKVTGACDRENLTITFKEDEYVPSLKFDCDDEFGIKPLTVYAIDDNGNVSSCNVELFIADRGICDDSGTEQITGRVTDRNYKPLEEVNIEAVKNEEVMSAVMSNESGIYDLSGIIKAEKNTVLMPSKKDDSKDGLDVNDLLYMLRHITRVERFDNVLEYAAADLNSDAAITLDDYWLLAEKIYDIPSNKPAFKPWKFFEEKKLGGERRASKLVVPIPVKHLKGRYDIMGIKVGDIDFSLLGNKKANWRSVDKLNSTYEAHQIGAGEELSFDMSELQGIGAVTFTFATASENLIQAVSSNGDNVPFISRIEGGELLVTVMDGNGFEGSLILRTANVAELSNVSSGIKVDAQNEMNPISIDWTRVEVGTVELTAAPNPFDEAIQVNYSTAEAGEASVELININGQRLLAQKITLETGVNHISLQTEELSSGIYMIKVSTATTSKVLRVTKSH